MNRQSFMDNAVFEFGQFRRIPAVGGPDKITGYALQFIDIAAAAPGTRLEMFLRVFVATFHAAVAVMVHRTISDIVFIHKVDDVSDRLGIVGGVAVYFNIEDMAAAGQFVVRPFHFGLMAGRTVVIHRDMIRVRIIDFIGDSGENTEALAVLRRKLAGETFGGGGEYREVMAIRLGEFIGAGSHVGNDAQTEFLGFL